MRKRPFLTAFGAALACIAGHAGAQAPVVDRVLIVMRHGVRPPTKEPPMPAGTASDPWPDWPVKPGYLTVRGARNMELLGAADRQWLEAEGVLPTGRCPAKDLLKVVADSDERTIESAAHWLSAVAAGCNVVAEHKPQDVSDPLFSPFATGAARLDPALASAAVQQALDGRSMAQVEEDTRPLLNRMSQVLCGLKQRDCGLAAKQSSIAPISAGKKVSILGPLNDASTAGQIFLLEYADGKPMNEVGWGRVTAKDIAGFSAFHAIEYRIVGRPRYLAAANLALLLPMMRNFLSDEGAGPRVLMLSAHDTQVASLGGMLGAHWTVPGAASDDPTPAGAIIIERLRGRHGERSFRAFYRAQSLEQLRALSPVTSSTVYRKPLALDGCRASLCTAEQFEALLTLPGGQGLPR